MKRAIGINNKMKKENEFENMNNKYQLNQIMNFYLIKNLLWETLAK